MNPVTIMEHLENPMTPKVVFVEEEHDLRMARRSSPRLCGAAVKRVSRDTTKALLPPGNTMKSVNGLGDDILEEHRKISIGSKIQRQGAVLPAQTIVEAQQDKTASTSNPVAPIVYDASISGTPPTFCVSQTSLPPLREKKRVRITCAKH
jgi:hypothetical protein